MGVHGLTSFVSAYREQYKEKIYIRESPVLIDGCNLMYYLYFDGKNAVVPRGVQKKSEALKALPPAYLFGGDWEAYAQNVRYFFQQLKLCEIVPVVLLDGAYDMSKLEVAKQRFEKSVLENVRPPRADGSLRPGKTYTPIFLKTVFVEVLAEQNIIYYQTIGEADNSIAFIARLLGGCPILSSDSDFLVYTNAKSIPFTSLKFGKARPSKNSRTAKKKEAAPVPDKVWTLQADYVSLPKLCREEFKLRDPQMLGLAAVMLGNDKVHHRHYKKFLGGGPLKPFIRRVMQWLAKQKDLPTAVQGMLDYIPSHRRKKVEEGINASLSDYSGEGGEYVIWQCLKEEQNMKEWIDQDLVHGDEFLKEFSRLSIQEVDNAKTTVLISSGVRLLEPDEPDHLKDDDEEFLTITVPEWYASAHVRSKMQTYLLNILKNRTVFLPPQIEIYQRPSCHEMSIPIIQATAGILIGNDKLSVDLITHLKGRSVKSCVRPILTIPGYGTLPVLLPEQSVLDSCTALYDVSCHDDKVKIMIACLGFHGNEPICKFVEAWPASYRFWILTLLYYTKMQLNEIEAVGRDFGVQECLAMALAIFLSIIKNLLVNPGTMMKNNAENKCVAALNSLSVNTIKYPLKLKSVRDFYHEYENMPFSSKNYMRGYDIRLPNALSKYVCTLYHAEMLNNLLQNPYKSPKIRYTLNNFFVYRFAEKVCETHCRIPAISGREDVGFAGLVREVVQINEIQNVLISFLELIPNL